MVLFTI